MPKPARPKSRPSVTRRVLPPEVPEAAKPQPKAAEPAPDDAGLLPDDLRRMLEAAYT